MADEVERMARALDAIKGALLERKLSDADLADARAALEELRSVIGRSGVGTHSITELEGLGKEFWRSIDVDEYLKTERDSWERPLGK